MAISNFSVGKLGALVVIAATLSACSVFGEKRIETPLPALTGTNPARLVWSQAIGKGGVGFAPVLVNNQVFAAAADGTVVRVDAATGQTVWRASVGKELSSGVGSDGETAVVVTRDGDVVALAGNGSRKWSVALKLDSTTPPAVGVGIVLVRSSENRVVALDLDNGRIRWSFQRTAPSLVLRQANGISMSSGTAFVGLAGGRLVALGLNDGALRWEATVAQAKGGNDIERISDVVGTPLVIGREVCAASTKGNIACFDTNNGQPLWTRAHSSNVGLDIEPRLVISPTDDSQVIAFSRAGGAPAWTQAGFKNRDLSAPIFIGNAVLLGDRDGSIHVLAKNDGAVLGRMATDGSAIVSQAASSPKQVVLLTSGGLLLSYQVE